MWEEPLRLWTDSYYNPNSATIVNTGAAVLPKWGKFRVAMIQCVFLAVGMIRAPRKGKANTLAGSTNQYIVTEGRSVR